MDEKHILAPAPVVDTWKHRRRMAYMAVVGGLVAFPILCVLNPEIMPLAGPYYTFAGIGLLAYKATAVIETVKGKK